MFEDRSRGFRIYRHEKLKMSKQSHIHNNAINELTQSARKTLLPSFVVTEVVQAEEDGAVRVALPAPFAHVSYYVRHKHPEISRQRFGGKPRRVRGRFNLYPVVLDASGTPWAEANVYLLSRIDDTESPSMATYASIAGDLAAYRRFLDETEIDWMHFPSQKLNRPTYRYNGHLKLAVASGVIAGTTAKRRMSAVIVFYSWLKDEGVLIPEHTPWKSSDRYIELKSAQGFKFSKKVVTTDISIRVPKQSDPYSGIIEDGGKLRPLPVEEQGWVMDALISQGNTEMTLIHLLALLTGARIQTILTFRVRHVLFSIEDATLVELRFPVGPGSGIDTKHDKQLVLHIPIWFYQALRTYAHSDRARKRRERAAGGDTEDQYLFLSVRGVPFYRNKEESRAFDETNQLRHAKTGQGVRQFMVDRIIPFVRAKYSARFHYKFHDTRASFGMNITDYQLALVERGEITLSQAREFVKTRMGHESSATTDLYLQHRHNLKFVHRVGEEYESHLKKLCEQAIGGLL